MDIGTIRGSKLVFCGSLNEAPNFGSIAWGGWQRTIGFLGFDTVIVGPLVQGLRRCGVGVRIKV